MGYAHRSVNSKGQDAQAVLEFTFGMIIVLLMVYALMSIFRWSGVSMAERRIAHEQLLTNIIAENYGSEAGRAQGPLKQIDPFFYRTKKVRAVYGE